MTLRIFPIIIVKLPSKAIKKFIFRKAPEALVNETKQNHLIFIFLEKNDWKILFSEIFEGRNWIKT